MHVFVSYKSEDCNVVREVVEILLSAGVPVWFAEYEILPSQYDVFDRDLEANLQNAVRGCTHALVFTNNRWSQSDYCRAEMRAVTAAISAQDIIEVRIPHEELPHCEYQMLEHGKTLDYAQDPAATAASVLKLLGIEGASPARAAALSGEMSFRLWRFGLVLNPGPFESSIKGSKRASEGHGAPSVLLQAELNTQTVQLVIVLQLFDSVLRSLEISQEGTAADREVYKGYRQYAQKWEGDTSVLIRGLHLFFWNRRSQLALTYVTPSKNSDNPQGSWERRYVLSPRGAGPAERGEIHFIFYAPDIKGTPEEQFRKFTALCPFFDQLIQTIKYRPVNAREDLVNTVPMVLVRLLYLTVIGWGAYALISRPELADWLILLAMAAGIACAELAVVLCSRVYRQLVWMMERSPLVDSLEGTYSRITANISGEFMGCPTLWVITYFTDLVITLGATRGRGTLLFPGPGLVWLVPIWLLLISYGFSNLGLSWSVAFGFLAALIVGLMVVLRFVCYRIHGLNWKDLELR
jgi:hypothetical protein